MKCGYCEQEMMWIGDHEDCDERTFSHYECKSCNLELFKYWNEADNYV